MAGSSKDLNQEIYDSSVVSHYRMSTSRINNVKVNDSFDRIVFNAVSAIADIIPTKAEDALSIGKLARFCPILYKWTGLSECSDFEKSSNFL